jgi:protein tyrosine/serine phosphatase
MAQVLTLNRRRLIVGLALVPTLAFARDAKWAKPLQLDGVPNLNQVAPNLYRAAQPTDNGFKAAEQSLKIQTVINLRESQNDTALLKGTQISEQSVPMNALSITNAQIIAALKLIKSGQAKGPVLVHCKHGADRTGVVIAMYRILYQGWTKQQAIDEMEHGGYNFHSIFFNIPAFVKNADIPAFKLALAIPE